MKIEFQNLQNLVYNINNSYSISELQSSFDKVNGIDLSNEEKEQLSDLVIFFIENLTIKEKDFVLSILKGFISKNLNNSFYIEYYKIRLLVLFPEIESYKKYLTEVVSKNIIFLNDNLKTRFSLILITMSNTLNDINITKNINNYISSLGISTDIDITDIKEAKYIELNQACENAILGGFYSTAYKGINQLFGSDKNDQSNILDNAIAAESKLNGSKIHKDYTFMYHAKGKDYVEWEELECIQLFRDWKEFKKEQLIKNKKLQEQVKSLKNINDVLNVKWDTAI